MIEELSFIDQLRAKLLLDLPGKEAHRRMIPQGRNLHLAVPEDAHKGGVMILLYDLDKQWNTVLIRRTEDGHAHSGQISFPGGKKDLTDRDIMHTAMRECEEEIGIPMSDIDILGTLSNVYIPPSRFLVTPTLGYIKNVRQFKASEKEVQEIIQLPLDLLFHKDIKCIREVTPSSRGSQAIQTPAYALADDLIVWGATAMIIAEFEQLINSI